MSLERQMRRKAERKRLAAWAKSLPEIPMGDAFTPGKVTHAVIAHDDHCKTLQTGNGSDCDCSPAISYHRE